jgi:hypothetical protein
MLTADSNRVVISDDGVGYPKTSGKTMRRTVMAPIPAVRAMSASKTAGDQFIHIRCQGLPEG